MAWVRFEDVFCDHPKLLELPSGEWRWAHVSACCMSARHGTDGFLSPAVVRQVSAGVRGGSGADIGTDEVAAEFVAAGLWEEVDGGWLIHDWDVYNPPAKTAKDQRDSKERERQRWREQKRRQRARKRGEEEPQHSDDAPPEPADTVHPVSAPSALPRGGPRAVSRPDPTPREGREGRVSGLDLGAGADTSGRARLGAARPAQEGEATGAVREVGEGDSHAPQGADEQGSHPSGDRGTLAAMVRRAAEAARTNGGESSS